MLYAYQPSLPCRFKYPVVLGSRVSPELLTFVISIIGIAPWSCMWPHREAKACCCSIVRWLCCLKMRTPRSCSKPSIHAHARGVSASARSTPVSTSPKTSAGSIRWDCICLNLYVQVAVLEIELLVYQRSSTHGCPSSTRKTAMLVLQQHVTTTALARAPRRARPPRPRHRGVAAVQIRRLSKFLTRKS